MIPSRYEYLTVVVILFAFVASTFLKSALLLSRRLEFWLSLIIFLSMCFCLDYLGLRVGWWRFAWTKSCGLSFLGLPIEEFILYSLIFVLAVSAWEQLE